MPGPLEASEVETLLRQLCVDLGFCLPPDAHDRLVDNPPADARSFTDAVFVAEGLNPETARRELYLQVSDYVNAAFARATQRSAH
jgi:hypothetical protein